MAIRFLLSDDDELIWDIDDHSEPLTEQQAKLVALRQIAVSLASIAEGLVKIAPRAEARPAAAARPAKRKAAPKRKGKKRR